MKENGNIMKENLLINEFFQKLTEAIDVLI